MDDEEHTSAFLAMSWQLPPELEMPPALSSLPWENMQSTEAATAEAAEARFTLFRRSHLLMWRNSHTHTLRVVRSGHPLARTTHTELYVALIRWHTHPTPILHQRYTT